MEVQCGICNGKYKKGKYIVHVRTPTHALAVAARNEAAYSSQQQPDPAVDDDGILPFVVDKVASPVDRVRSTYGAVPTLGESTASSGATTASTTASPVASPFLTPSPASPVIAPPKRMAPAAAPPPSSVADDFIEFSKPERPSATAPKTASTGPPPPLPHQDRPRPAWLRSTVYSTSLTQRLHEEILDYCRFFAPLPEEHALRRHVIELVRTVALRLWPACQVQVFGSFETQLYLPTSDLDLVVVGETGSNPLRKMAAALKDAGIVAKLELIEKARVPIIKFVDSIIGFDVDVSFNITSGVDSAQLVKEAITLHPAVRPLMVVLKEFLLERGLNEVFTGGVGSYGLALMILSFLQLHPRIQTGEIDPMENLGVLLVEFFELYGRSFMSQSISINVLNGGSYVQRFSRDSPLSGGSSGFHKPSPLSIVDPQNTTNDVSRGSFNYAVIKNVFAHAFNTLTSELLHYRNRASLSDSPASLLNLIVRWSPSWVQTREERLAAIRALNIDLSVYMNDVPVNVPIPIASILSPGPARTQASQDGTRKRPRQVDSDSEGSDGHDSDDNDHDHRDYADDHDDIYIGAPSESESDLDDGHWARRQQFGRRGGRGGMGAPRGGYISRGRGRGGPPRGGAAMRGTGKVYRGNKFARRGRF